MGKFLLTAALVALPLIISSCGGGGDDPLTESQLPTEPEVVGIVEEAPQSKETTETDSTATSRAISEPPLQREEPHQEPEPMSGQTSDQTEPATPSATPESEPTTDSTSPVTQTLAAPAPEPTSPSVLTWRGLVVAAEDRCSPYDSGDYRYSQSVEPGIVAAMGGLIYGPYSQRYFDSIGETDIEHIVARSEAHDSGLCAVDDATRKAFAEDLLNLTLASPSVNRHQKSDNDAAEWLPDHNRCWFADRVLQVRQKYGLTIDQAEADALESVLSGCSSVEFVVADGSPIPPTPTPAPTPTPTLTPVGEVDALAMWDSNGDGKITCAEAKEHGIAPVRRGHPAYPYMNDRDGDGIVCE